MSAFRRMFPKERHVLEVGAIGSTLFFVLSVLSFVALGYDIRGRAMQLVCVATSAFGFLVFMGIQTG